MAGITLADAEAQLAAWLAADAAVALNQSYTLETTAGRRTLTRADAAEISNKLNFWDSKVKILSAPTGRRGMRFLVN